MTYEISITAEIHAAGVEPIYYVSVIPPGELSAPTVKINEPDLEKILQEVLPSSSGSDVREHLKRAYSVDGDRIEIPELSEMHVQMLRGLQHRTVGR